ncbi:MAG: lysophospholipid acyltransferase family protein [Gammaproteobacteria bacterium]|nr:lysophospholipid acyltransferase family protein [Gammaproteobacteria bacterium]
MFTRMLGVLATLMAKLPLRWARAVGSAAATVPWLARSRLATTTEVNIAMCFPEKSPHERRRLVIASLQESGKLLAETGMLWRWNATEIESTLVRVTGTEGLETATASGRGTLLLLPHFGNWELMSFVVGTRVDLVALYDPPKLRGLDTLVTQARERWGPKMYPPTVSGIRALFQALRDGKALALLPDQVPAPGAGLHAPFFNHCAFTMTFAHRIIRRADPLVLIGYAQRVKDGFDVRFQELDGEIRDPDPAVSAAAMNRAIEAVVRRDPAQYQWEYKRFRRQPDNVRIYDT